MLSELTNHLSQWEVWKRRLQSMPSKIARRSYLHSPILNCTTSKARHGIGTDQILVYANEIRESHVHSFQNPTPGHRMTQIPRQKKSKEFQEYKISRESEIKSQEDINGQNPTSGDFTPIRHRVTRIPHQKKDWTNASQHQGNQELIVKNDINGRKLCWTQHNGNEPTNEIDEKLFGHPRLKRNKNSWGHLNPEVQRKAERTTKLNKSGKLHESV